MAKPNTPRRILLVDDSPALLENFREVFEECGYEVMVATTATKAIQLLAGSDACVAVVDIARKDERSAETLQAIARLKPRMPIVVKVAFGDDASWVRRRHRNVAAAVVEPVAFGDLCSLIERVVSGEASLGIPPGLRSQWARVQPRPKSPPDTKSHSA